MSRTERGAVHGSRPWKNTTGMTGGRPPSVSMARTSSTCRTSWSGVRRSTRLSCSGKAWTAASPPSPRRRRKMAPDCVLLPSPSMAAPSTCTGGRSGSSRATTSGGRHSRGSRAARAGSETSRRKRASCRARGRAMSGSPAVAPGPGSGRGPCPGSGASANALSAAASARRRQSMQSRTNAARRQDQGAANCRTSESVAS